MNAKELSKGSWLVTVEDGSSSATTAIEPDFIELHAASHYVREAMVKAMHEKSQLRPRTIRMSSKEKKAWKAYEKIMGDDIPAYFEYASLYEIADAGIKVLVGKAKRKKQSNRKIITKINNTIMSMDL